MSEDQFIVVKCSCGRTLRAPHSSAGKRARCPACQNVITLSATPAAVAARVPVAASSFETDTGPDTDDLYRFAAQMEASAPVDNTARCPKCMTKMAPNAVLCTSCGYDTRNGKAIPRATAARATGALVGRQVVGYQGKKPVVDLMAPQGSFVAGLAMSGAFSVAASVLWFLVAYATGFTIAYIAILIGVAAGFGMRIGQKGFSSGGGYAAGMMTILAILLAKLAVLEVILARSARHLSIRQLDPSTLGYYFFNPIGLIIIAIGVAAAFRTANGSVRN